MRTALSDDAMQCWDCKKRSQQKASTQMCQMRLHSTCQKSPSPDPAISSNDLDFLIFESIQTHWKKFQSLQVNLGYC